MDRFRAVHEEQGNDLGVIGPKAFDKAVTAGFFLRHLAVKTDPDHVEKITAIDRTEVYFSGITPQDGFDRIDDIFAGKADHLDEIVPDPAGDDAEVNIAADQGIDHFAGGPVATHRNDRVIAFFQGTAGLDRSIPWCQRLVHRVLDPFLFEECLYLGPAFFAGHPIFRGGIENDLKTHAAIIT